MNVKDKTIKKIVLYIKSSYLNKILTIDPTNSILQCQ